MSVEWTANDSELGAFEFEVSDHEAFTLIESLGEDPILHPSTRTSARLSKAVDPLEDARKKNDIALAKIRLSSLTQQKQSNKLQGKSR